MERKPGSREIKYIVYSMLTIRIVMDRIFYPDNKFFQNNKSNILNRIAQKREILKKYGSTPGNMVASGEPTGYS
jgi:hypothetical protein